MNFLSMIIKSIELFNIRSHKNTKITFDNGINVFIGGTGSGKTSILMAMEFALFGSESIKDFSMLLNRRAGMGKVVLEFEHNGKNYKIIRGLVREGKSIRTDNSSLKIYEDGRMIFSGGKVQEMNEKIKRILGFPKGINPANLFEILFYSRQDEIRKIIEMKKEERQTYIDNSLLLDRYKKTWENLKEIIDEFRKEADRMAIEIKMIEEYQREVEELSKKIGEKEKELETKNKELEELEKEYLSVKEEIERIKEEFSILEEKRESLIRKMEKEKTLEKEIERIKKEIAELEGKLEEVNYSEEEHKRLQNIKSEILGKISFLKNERFKIEREIEKMKKLKIGGECPLCKQKITKEHIDKVIGNLNSDKEKIIQELIVMEEKLDEINKKILEMEKLRRKKEENEKIRYLLKKKKEELEEKVKELNEVRAQKELLRGIEDRYHQLRTKKEELAGKFLEISRRYGELKSEVERIKKEIAEWKSRFDQILKRIEEIKDKEKKLEKLKSIISRLEFMREEIRKIREIVRLKFIEDFRREFSYWFKNIRREEYYRVDIDNEYEPRAYTPEGIEVPISSLSGGERTSVALAYRLALSSIVSKLGGVSKPEILILDEPTTGLDEDDIRVLPEVLRSLGLKQVIVVTHSRDLKEAGDVKFLVKREGGWTKVERIED